MSAKEMGSLDEFLAHRGNAKGGAYLKDWKKEGKLNVFLHTKILPVAVWQHTVPKIVLWEDKDTGDTTRRVWVGKFVCPEAEEVLQRQYKRDENSRARLSPPRKCGLCKLTEHVHSLVQEGKVGYAEKLFRFEAENPEDTRVTHAAGIYGGFPKTADEASPEETKAIRAAGISLRNAWEESFMAKLSYIMCVVVAAKPEDGVQIATETSLLGDKVKDVIRDRIESLGAEAGDPIAHPYCIQWVYDAAEKEPGKKYRARPIEIVKPTEAILTLIRGPKPDLSQNKKPFDPLAMRVMLETACLKPALFPWDELFGKKGDEEEDPDEEAEPVTQEQSRPARTRVAPAPQTIPCDDCKAPMGVNDPKCLQCGAEYNVEGEAPPPPPPPPPPPQASSSGRTRAARKGGRAAAPPVQATPAAEEDSEDEKAPF
jgi:hypothetical protein